MLGCSKDDKVYTDEVYILVDSKYADTPSNIYPNKSLLVKIEKESTEWIILYNNDIKGFEYEEGYTYRIFVKRSSNTNPPQDGSSVEYTLIDILNKEKAE